MSFLFRPNGHQSRITPGPLWGAHLNRLKERIRAHVVLCWLGLLLIRIAETQTGQTWRSLRRELERMHLGTFSGPAGTSRQRTETTPGQRTILRALDLPEPPRFLHLDPVTVTPA